MKDQLRILIVDDDPKLRKTLSDILERKGYKPITVATGKEALNKVREEGPALALIDLKLGDMSGLEVITEIKKCSPGTESIVLTGHASKESAIEAVNVGAYSYVQKPCDMDQLLLTIQRAIEKREAEENLRESEERYRTTFESTGTATVIVEEDTTISLANMEFMKLCGYSREEVEGKKCWTEFVVKEDLEGMKEYHRLRRTAEGGAPGSYEFRFTDRHGNVRDIFLTATLIPGTKKTVASLLDITERKLLEAQLQHTRKMEAVGTLAGGMAHEFNNLMTAVLSYSSFLLTDLGEDDPMRKDVEEIKSAGKRASSLVKHLLAFSRKQVLQPKPLDINSVLTDKEEMLGHLIGEDVELEMVLEQDLDKVKADQSQVEQVILNLTINARDAMPLGGKLTIETANVEIDEFYVSTHGDELKPGPYVMLAMSDTGMGMDKETQSQIFEPFFTTKDMGEGTGLGLSAVYGIVKQSGGDIRVYSEPEKGTIFKIYLPRMEQDVEAVHEGYAVLEQLGGSETVLLVEDNDLVRKVSRRVLEQYGYRVLEAEDAHKALMISEQHQGLIELMVTDVVMPEMSGKELAERLKVLRPETKVLYMSGYTDNAVVRRGVISKDVDFLEKPFTPDVLAEKVRQVLDEKERRKSR